MSKTIERIDAVESFQESVVRDLRSSFRSLGASWGFTLGSTVVLALAIAATAAIFAVVNTVLLQPLAYPDADRIVAVETAWAGTAQGSPQVSTPDFLAWQTQVDVFESLAYYSGEEDVATVVDGRAEFANDMYVSPEFFDVFGQQPAAGRLLTEQDVVSGDTAPSVIVVRHAWAEAHYGSAEAAVGKTIIVYGTSMQIVGVAAPGFSFPGRTDFWTAWRSTNTDRNAPEFDVIGKLRAGQDLEGAHAGMRVLSDNLAQQYPENRLKSASLVPLQERLTAHVQTMLWLLLGAVLVVLLIACANVSSLLIARAGVRARDIALRAALGASRGRLIRQLLLESCVLAALSAVLGLALAAAFIWGLQAWLPTELPRLHEVRMDLAVIGFVVCLALASVALFALLPAIHVTRLDLSQALKLGGSKGATAGDSSGLRAWLVVAEVALSVTLLVSAGLLLRSFQTLQQVDVGFAKERVMLAYTQYPVDDDEDRRQRTAFYGELIERLRETPGITAAAGVSFLPMGKERRPARNYFVQGLPEGLPGEQPMAQVNAITRGYFSTLDIPLLEGRDFQATDTPDQPPRIIINQALARASFADQSPLGRQIRFGHNAPWMEVVGVVGDVRWQDPDQAPPPVIYAASTQGVGGSLSIIARSALAEASLADTMRRVLHEANPDIPARFETMTQLFDGALAYPRFRSQLVAAFAASAALLAAVGIFSVLAYLVGQRSREIAVRRAVGARSADVMRLIVGQGMRLVAAGLLLGLLGAFAVANTLRSLLFEISPWDVEAYVGAILVLGIAALLATLIPAIRATSIEPVAALQQ
ncbi:MAG: ABC transporter permease [Pseudomarimonas sp.]